MMCAKAIGTALAAAFVLVAAGPAFAQAPAQGRGAQPAPAAPAPPNLPTPGPSLAEAQKAIAAAHGAAEKMGVNLSCAVVDSRGDVVAIARMDKARFLTVDVARGKALMSASFGQPSGNFTQINPAVLAALNNTAQGRMLPVQGAVPIRKGDQVLGAIGCSGATSQQDEDAAKAGLATLGGQS